MIKSPSVPVGEKSGNFGQNRGSFSSGIPQPVLEKILCPIIAICFRVFTSEKWMKNGNYARFLANYARIPWRDCDFGLLPGSSHRRRSGERHLSKGYPLSQVDGRSPQETVVGNIPATETIRQEFFLASRFGGSCQHVHL
jgi:hypothetical protein